jgi:glycosyltransferase involved in cell wall biosynthesis
MKIHVIEVGIDYNAFQRDIQKNIKLRVIENKQTKKEEFLIIYSGILGPAYDFELLLRAASIAEKNLDLPFKIIIQGKGDLEPFIYSLISKFNLKKVFVNTNHLDFDEYIEFLLKADVFVLPMKKGLLYSRC